VCPDRLWSGSGKESNPAGCPNYWPHAGIQTTTATVQVLLRCADLATRLSRVYGSAAPTVFDEAGAEYSVVRLSDTSYRLISSQITFGPVRRFPSTTPRGPWRAASVSAAYSPPEMHANGRAIHNETSDLRGCQLWSYGAKEHPEFNDPGRVVISNNVGVMQRDKQACDIHKAQNVSADNYRQVFIDIAG
jgi:hypothetical protein